MYARLVQCTKISQSSSLQQTEKKQHMIISIDVE